MIILHKKKKKKENQTNHWFTVIDINISLTKKVQQHDYTQILLHVFLSIESI